MKQLLPTVLFCFAALGFVWAVEAFAAVVRQLLGL